MDKQRVLLATTNPAKLERLRWILDGLDIETATPDDLGLPQAPPEEDGATHEENARIKAESWSRAASMPALATDGGLDIPALGGRWESLLTHRFAGDEADDAARLERLLDLMAPLSGSQRTASWVEAVAVAENGSTLASWSVEGATGILADSSGRGPAVPGFWVFSAWYFPRLGKTYNELTEAERDVLNDHWSRLRPLVRGFFIDRFSLTLNPSPEGRGG